MQQTVDAKFYDSRYFEDGIASGKSCYTNYRWIPELTIPMAYWIIRALQLDPGARILDYGCSKGYVVKALRLLGMDAWGVDISSYAVRHCDADVRDYCHVIEPDRPVPVDGQFDLVMTKDVLEHMDEKALNEFLEHYTPLTMHMWHVIPLGDSGVFRIPEYHADRSHIQIQNEQWWEQLFMQHGWRDIRCQHYVKGIKDNWADRHAKGNGFFDMRRH